MFTEYNLMEFSAIDDNDHSVENTDMASFSHTEYSCGLFKFVRR